ncbi:MAG: methionine synthase, partial [Verrucomicrobiales bacterium]|nr:methionine synthase [Verrucomicrobiales bacterium]
MHSNPLRTSVIGSYPFPGWLELASRQLDQFGSDDLAELQDDAVVTALHDQLGAGLDVVTDGEQTRLDFNLSFYGYIEGIALESSPPRRFGPPAHDQRGKHAVTGPLRAPRGLGAVEEFRRLQRLTAHLPARSARTPTLKASVPGPYTLSGRLLPNPALGYPDRWALTEALLPLVRKELEDLVAAGCAEISVDEPSMSCYAYREDTRRFVDIFNRTVESVGGRTRVCTHLCFGNYKARAVGPRRIAPMFPAFLDFRCDEMHVEMASREFAELDILEAIARRMDAAVGIVDVKSYYVETPDDIAD